MKRFLFVLAVLVFLGGCAGLELKNYCDGQSLPRPSFFERGEYLAAFRVTLHAKGSELQTLLQIKKTDPNTYQAILFAAAGGYKLMQASVTEDKVTFDYVTEPANVALVREKAASFLTLLLFPPSVYKSCREKDGQRTVTYGEKSAVHYVYLPGQAYPRSVTQRKKFGTARLNFAEYMPAAAVPQYIYYEDGSAEADLVLLTLKK